VSAAFEHYWQYGIKCDHPECGAVLWRIGGSEADAYTRAQVDAMEAGWSVAKDRLVSNRDLCREHARSGGMRW
jgi:hypothetical protein